MEGELAIRMRGVVKRYGEITAVAGLDLDVPVGTCVGLLGPNGAGKSTTMRLLTAQCFRGGSRADCRTEAHARPAAALRCRRVGFAVAQARAGRDRLLWSLVQDSSHSHGGRTAFRHG